MLPQVEAATEQRETQHTCLGQHQGDQEPHDPAGPSRNGWIWWKPNRVSDISCKAVERFKSCKAVERFKREKERRDTGH